MKDENLTILNLVKGSIADNSGISDSLIETTKIMLEWSEHDLTGASAQSREKIEKRITDIKEALRLIDEHHAMIAAKVAAGPQSFPVGTTVRIKEIQIDWRGEEAPTVGLVGVVAALDASPWPEPPEGKTAVRFRSNDVGYEEDEDGSFDDNHIVYYIWTFSLEEVPEGTKSILPEPRVYNPHPAPEGHRWAILYESNGNPDTELGGHCCGCYEQMIEYTEKLFGRVEAIKITEQNTPPYLHGGIRI